MIEENNIYTVTDDCVNILKKYIRFLADIEITDEIDEEIKKSKSEVFEIKPGYRPHFFNRNEEQSKNYLLIGDAAAHVDFFSGHGIDNAEKTSENFVRNLPTFADYHTVQREKIFELKDVQKFTGLCKKVQIFNCWKHKTSILRKPVNFNEQRFQLALRDFYKTTESQNTKVRDFFKDLGQDELKVLFNPMNDTHGNILNSTAYGHSFDNIQSCKDEKKKNPRIKKADAKEVMKFYWGE